MTRNPFSVVIAGAGVAGIETALALRDLAGDRVELTLLADEPDFVYRPWTVAEPFSYATAQHYPLDRIAQDLDVRLIPERLQSVDRREQMVVTEEGRQVRYDALMASVGARFRRRYEHAITLDDRRLAELLSGLIDEIDRGEIERLAFVTAPRMAWPFPLYELALMSARRAADAGVKLAITLLTAEHAPLGLFGPVVSRQVSQLLVTAGIKVIARARCEIPETGRIVIEPDLRPLASGAGIVRPGRRTREFDRIVALPELTGPDVSGLPRDLHGFIPIDGHARVRGVHRVYAAGDATTFPVKHGGVAAQQADTAAAAIAALADAPIQPRPFQPVVRGILLTGEQPRYLTAHVTGGHAFSARLTTEPSWHPAGKITAKYLTPYLESLDAAHAAA